ncbi:tetratricopeptide repeat protein [Sneathiella glossodoripedis]|uniref:tetratricopeptide repeat protein n=1 Tax=Sneathiella glossodoripedis TaxID=418853 RepID=UPI00047043DC|nr:tetratricopeptide repeat protein [Sneathiella glossodoripedis]
MSDIFSEVDEEVRKEKSLELWKAYGKYIIGASVLIVGVTAAVVGWKNYQLGQAQTQGDQYFSAARMLQEGKYVEASDAFAMLAGEGSESYAALAALSQARALIAAGKGDEAVAVYDTLAASEAAPEFTAAAKIMAGYYLIDNGSADDVRARVSDLEGAGSLWSASAQELLALAALKDGKKEEAAALLKALSTDAAAPHGIKSRALQLLSTLGN